MARRRLRRDHDVSADRWALMALHLAGEPLPALPRIRGQRHHPLPDSDVDPHARQWEVARGLERWEPPRELPKWLWARSTR